MKLDSAHLLAPARKGALLSYEVPTMKVLDKSELAVVLKGEGFG
ncbi:hypothetical protein [Vibrio cholerae]|nr:hypothetical protein [Vibrio cholerae]